MFFSIITVSYNSEKTIERTIKSVLAQSFHDFEYIIVDGASGDSTLDIIKKYEPLFEDRMKWISEPDKGIYNAMNKGIKLSSGAIIGIVNSDDWLEVDALSVLAGYLQDDSSNFNKILTGEMMFHYEDGTTHLFSTSVEQYEYYSKRFRMGLNHPATFVPRIIYDQIGLFDERFSLYADADFFISCYEQNVGVCFVNKVLSNMSDGGASNKVSKKMLSDGLLTIRKHARSTSQMILLSLKLYILLFLKKIIPMSLVRVYRNR